ncbi:MAG: DUF1932 domain-containing protein [Rhodospirillaceae bacterium]
MNTTPQPAWHSGGGLTKIALIGCGEAAGAFVAGWGPDWAARISAYDLKTDHQDPAVREAKQADYAALGVTGSASPADALEGAQIALSLVTADQALAAAETAAQAIPEGCFYFDGNSCAPGTKRQAAALIEAAGGRYVDMAVMAPVYPKRHKTPLLLSGPHAQVGQAVLTALEMVPDCAEGPVGVSSAIKMIRSVMVKGMEALFLECVLAGRRAGVDGIVLDSLEASFPGFGFKDRAAYNMERVTTHGLRRAAEMREVAKTVQELGLSGGMAEATVAWQQAVGALGIEAATVTGGVDQPDYSLLAEAILAGLAKQDDAA